MQASPIYERSTAKIAQLQTCNCTEMLLVNKSHLFK